MLEIESFYRSGKNTAKTALLDFICVIDVSIAFEAICIIQKIAVTTDDIENWRFSHYTSQFYRRPCMAKIKKKVTFFNVLNFIVFCPGLNS